jgi:hypothetical protein
VDRLELTAWLDAVRREPCVDVVLQWAVTGSNRQFRGFPRMTKPDRGAVKAG